jgi:hypothetical protein
MRDPVQQDGVKTRISQRDLPYGAQCRVALGNNLDVFFNTVPHAKQA